MRGEVVVIPFPFSDLSNAKPRPVLILVEPPGNDIVVAAITSSGTDPNGVQLIASDFQSGGIPNPVSIIRPTKIATIERNLIIKSAGILNPQKRQEVVSKLITLLS